MIEVARQLFARIGVENTTMNDIAQASKKGRRTLYTYFNNKNEVYLAVIESELNNLYATIQEGVAKDLPADKKLITYIYTRLDAVKNIVFRNGTLRAYFFRDIWKVQNVRKKFDIRDMEIIKSILEDGVKNGIFNVSNIDITASIIHHAVKGLEVPYIRGKMGFEHVDHFQRDESIINIIFNGIRISK